MTLDAGMSEIKVSKDLMLSKAPFFKIAVWLRPHLANGQCGLLGLFQKDTTFSNHVLTNLSIRHGAHQ